MTPTEEKLLDALENCVEFIEDAHILEGQWHWQPIEKAQAAMATARQSEPPNFCARCGKRLTPEGVHTCTPPMSRDAELEQARAEEREACVAIAKDAVDGTTVSKYATSREARAARGMAAHILSAIRARGQK